MKEHIDAYVNWCRLHGENEHNIKQKHGFITEISKQIDLLTVKTIELETFVYTNYSKLGFKTFNNRLSFLTGFYDYLCRCEVVTRNTAQYVQRKKYEFHVQRSFTLDEVEKIINFKRPPRRSKKEFEMYSLFFKLIAYTGLRRSEGLNLLIEDVYTDKESPYIVVRKTKNKSDRPVPIPVGFDRELLDYATKYSKRYVFESRLGNKIDPWSVTKAFRRRLLQMGMEEKAGVGLHAFRRSYVTTLLNKGVPVHKVARIVGHQKIDTTMLYYAYAFEDAHEVANNHPLFKTRGDNNNS